MMLLTRESTLPSVIDHMRLIPVGEGLWRVIDPVGRAAGHLQATGAGAHQRFTARRFHMATGVFRDLGSFWTTREAVECLRLSR